MCGISGIFLNKKADKKELGKTVDLMNEFQKRRGPDDEGIFIDSSGLGLGHCRLAIIDISKAGHQPMEYKDLRITFNGEIYNFLELKKNLEKKGYKFKTKTDTEVILALYAEYGEKSFSMLRGMFAFGLWDGKNQRLFLVKDRYGIKPLYYYADNEKLIFASTVKAIGESGLIAVQKNPQALIGFLLFGSVPLPITTIKNVFSVPAGHYLIREADGGQKLIRYYEPLEFFQRKNLPDINRENFLVSDVQKFNDATRDSNSVRNLLEESVNLHLISDVPLGVFLSGGLDSSAIAALAAKNREKPITTLSIIFDEKEFSEEKYSDLVAAKIKSDHRKIKITAQDFYDSFDEIFKAMDQPTINGVNTFFIAKAAKQAGLKTVLSGLGGDEIFLGYPYFKKAELLREIQDLPKFIKYPLNLISLLGDRYAKASYFINSDILSFYLGIRGLFSPKKTARILDTNLSEVESFTDDFSRFEHYNITTLQHLSPVDLLSYLELKFYLPNQLLKDTDFMSMYHSIEVRVPFLDHPLVEYLSSLSNEIKFGTSDAQNINKPLLAAAVKNLLPQEIFNRPKMGFTFPFQKWFQEMEDKKRFALSDLGLAKTHWSRFWAKMVLSKFNQ